MRLDPLARRMLLKELQDELDIRGLVEEWESTIVTRKGERLLEIVADGLEAEL